MTLPEFVQTQLVADRFKQIEGSEFFAQEVKILSSKRVSDYYKKVIDTVKLDKNNKSNSYVMWVVGKVDKIDLEKPAKIKPPRAALPDIDSDFEITRREDVIQHVRETFGEDKVCQMSTFSRMQGRGALKDVLRAHERCSYEEMNTITEHIPDESEISDQLQVMREETGEASIIRWALENNGEALKQWCYLTEDGKLDGPLALDFEQAIRLEGTKRNMGKHASGLIICSDVLADIVPMVWDKSSGQMIVGVDMRDAESMGLVKFDILGTAVLDKISMAQRIIRGEI